MKVSVAICTWNRAELLAQTLDHIASVVRVPRDVEWELLVVNNAAEDDTDAVIADYSRRLPLRRLYEPRGGQSFARNLASREARGDYLIWTDDDVLVDSEWLTEYCRAFQQYPGASFFGGPIEPWFSSTPAEWFLAAWPLIRTAYAVVDHGPELQALTAERLPYGANMAFRSDVLRHVPFDTRVGHNGNAKVGGEETLLMRHLISSGAEGWWLPGARVQHLIPSDRQTLEYLRSYYHGRGTRLRVLEMEAKGAGNHAGYWHIRRIAGLACYHIGRLASRPRLYVRGLRAALIAEGVLGR